MPNLFYPLQTDYIERLNTLATTESITDGSVAASFLSLMVAGLITAGAGLQVNAQALAPATPASGYTIFADATHVAGWKGQNGYVVKLNGTANTADRTYTLPNASGTFALLSLAQTFSAAQSFSAQSNFAAGSAAAPGVRVGTVQDGLYSLSAGTLGIATNGAQAVRVDGASAAVNYLWMYSNTAGQSPVFSVLGSDAAVTLTLTSKGTGPVDMLTGTATQFQVGHTALAVNLFRVTGAVTGGSPVFSVIGSDANISASYSAKGTGVHRFITTASNDTVIRAERTGTGASFIDMVAYSGNTTIRSGGAYGIFFGTNAGTTQLYLTHTAGAVNFAQITGAAAGGGVRYGVEGSDSNITWTASSKGTFGLGFYTNAFANLQFVVSHTANAVNYVFTTGGATTAEASLTATGSDAAVAFGHHAKGAGLHRFTTGSVEQFRVSHAASAANFPYVQGGATGVGARYGVAGSDTNITYLAASKGTGGMNFYTADFSRLQAVIADTASAVNFLVLSGGPAASPVSLSAAGSDSNVSLQLASKANGTVYALVRGAVAVEITNPASAVNSLVLSGSAAGSALTISSGGSDANRTITVLAGGSGVVALGNGTSGSIFGVGPFSGADKAIYILNTTTAPSSNPAAGGYLYCEGGALKYRGSSGTVTTIAPA